MTNKTKYPIFILSKARAKQCLTANLFEKYNTDFKIVVEPQDFNSYKQVYNENKLIIMDRDNAGIAYVRNYIKSFSKSHNDMYHWQIDDNISNFRRRIDNKNTLINPLENLLYVEDYVSVYNNIGLAGLKHRAFAFASKVDLSFNQQIYSCFLVNNTLDISWRSGLIEDTDYSLQVLYKNYCTVMFNRLIIDKAKTMSMKGGNTEISHGGDGRENRSIGLQKMWPDIFYLTEQYGRIKVKPSRIWSKFSQRPIKNES